MMKVSASKPKNNYLPKNKPNKNDILLSKLYFNVDVG